MATTVRECIDEFLLQKRLAVVGVSRNPDHFTRRLFDELRQRGYDLVPVNPNADEIDGLPCYANVQEIQPPVDGALLLVPPEMTDSVVADCLWAGVPRVWMHKGEGIGAVSQQAIEFCQKYDISVIAGFCPFMFLPRTAFFHRAHGFFKKLTGSYPN